MQNSTKVFLATLGLGLLAHRAAQAQTSVGNGATAPRTGTMLDVNGPIAVTETAVAVASNAATIPATAAQARLTGAATAAIALSTAGTPVAGQRLVVVNNTTGGYTATLNGQTIPAGQAVEFFYSTVGSVAGYRASAGGGNGPNLYTADGTLAANRTVTQGGRTLGFTGGNVGIGNNAPTLTLDVVGQLGIRNNAAWDHLYFSHDGSTASMLAGGVETGLAFSLGQGSTGTYGDASQNYREVMRLLPSGNVGIGTTTPGTTLAVAGTLGTTGAATLGSTLGVTGAATLNSTLAVAGATTLASTLAVTDVATFNNGVNIKGNTASAPFLNVTTTVAAVNSVPANTSGNVSLDVVGTENYVFGGNVAPRDNNSLNLGLSAARWSTIYGVNQSLTGGLTYTPGGTAPASGSVLTSDATGLASWSTPASIATSGGAATSANNGLTLASNAVQLGGSLTKATNIALGTNNLTLSTGTTGTGVLVLDGQGIAGSTANTAKQRIEFTSNSDPNAAIGHTVAAGSTEINDLYLYAGNDNGSGFGPDRIRLVGENILFQSFNNAGNSTLANAESNTSTVTNMFIGFDGTVGIGTAAPNTTLSITPSATAAKITLFDGGSTTAHYGFGISNSQLNYEAMTGASHVFYINGKNASGTEVMRVNAAGTYIRTSGGPQLAITTTTNAIGPVPANTDGNIYYETGGTENHVFGGNIAPDANGSRTLGLAAARWATIYSVNALNTSSDRRLKKDIKTTTYGLKDVLKMNPVTYRWKKDADGAGVMLGFIAQEMEQIVPESVVKPGGDQQFYSMKYTDLIPVLTKAMQEQQAQIEALQTANAQLASANAGLRASLDGKASASTLGEMQAALQALRAEVQGLKAGGTTASSK